MFIGILAICAVAACGDPDPIKLPGSPFASHQECFPAAEKVQLPKATAQVLERTKVHVHSAQTRE